ncbi:MAG: 50S ribosomal protein L32 [Chloroflexi bacterium]|nr:50S ribosomal protein L32 [Chloroflexota bacterium]
MGVPKRRTPRAKQRTRRSHHNLTAPQLVRCPSCRSMHVNHQPCKVCGTYHGRQALRQEEPAG